MLVLLRYRYSLLAGLTEKANLETQKPLYPLKRLPERETSVWEDRSRERKCLPLNNNTVYLDPAVCEARSTAWIFLLFHEPIKFLVLLLSLAPGRVFVNTVPIGKD